MKSQRTPPNNKLLNTFEADLFKLIRKIRFRKYHNHFQTKSNKDISIVKLTTLSEGDPKAPFSIATTPRCWRGRYTIPWIAQLSPYFILLSVKQGSGLYHF